MSTLSTVWNDFKLAQGTREPGSFRIGEGGGNAVLNGFISSANLLSLLESGLETAQSNNSTGRIRRTLPIAHPRYPWLFLQNVDNAQGVNFQQKEQADPDGYLEVASLPYYSEYEKYSIQATFSPRPYALIRDEEIPQYTISYYDSAGSPQTKRAYNEDWRYVEWHRGPAAEYLTADLGTWKFASTGTYPTNPVDGSSAGRGTIRQLVPASTWRLIWHKVPYNYVLSSNTYFDRYIGHINQKAIWGFSPGEALMQAINVLRVYSPQFPEFTSYGGYDVVSQDKLCDIEFVMLAVKRTATVSVTPSNASHIVGGHNCVTFAPNGKHYYVENFRTGSAGSGKPIYNSVPFDLFFQNPDAP